MAGLECDLVPTPTGVAPPMVKRARRHRLSALPSVFIFLSSVAALFLHRDMILGKMFACQTTSIKNGECVPCLCAL